MPNVVVETYSPPLAELSQAKQWLIDHARFRGGSSFHGIPPFEHLYPDEHALTTLAVIGEAVSHGAFSDDDIKSLIRCFAQKDGIGAVNKKEVVIEYNLGDNTTTRVPKFCTKVCQDGRYDFAWATYILVEHEGVDKVNQDPERLRNERMDRWNLRCNHKHPVFGYYFMMNGGFIYKEGYGWGSHS